MVLDSLGIRNVAIKGSVSHTEPIFKEWATLEFVSKQSLF